MKIGILNAFPPDWRSVELDGSPVDLYVRFLEQVEPPFTYQGFAVAEDEFPASPALCDAYLVTGSPRGVYDSDPWIARLGEFLRAAYREGRKLVGICFGHQILAHALGGHAAKSEKGWGLGLKTFDVYAAPAWMTPPAERCALHFVHQDQVMRLPPEAELLGGNDFCPNLFFVIGNQVLGIQGHPEFDADFMRSLIRARRASGIFPPDLAAEAEASLQSGTPHNRLLAQWIVNFLQA